MPNNASAAGFSLRVQILYECQAMARYAFSSGKTVPPSLVEKLEKLPTLPWPPQEPDSREEAFPPIDETAAKGLAEIHNRLTQIIAPAIPRSILLLAIEESRKSFMDFLGEVPLIRRMMWVAILSIIALFGITMTPYIDGDISSYSISHNDGLDLLINELLLLTAASLGACFMNLFRAKDYVRQATFDPKLESSYWIRYVLGLMSGTLLALLIPIEAWVGAADAAGQGAGAVGEGSANAGGKNSVNLLRDLSKPTLALVGGFSSDVVYRVLSRIVAAVDTLVRGDGSDAEAARAEAAQAQLSERETQNRVQLAARLTSLRQKLADTDDPKVVLQEIDRLQQQLIHPDGIDDDEDGATDAMDDQKEGEEKNAGASVAAPETAPSETTPSDASKDSGSKPADGGG